MAALLFINIKQLVGVHKQNTVLRGSQLAELPILENAFLLVEDGIIVDFGAMYALEINVPQLPKNVIDCQGQFILPCWCDSHTHLVFAKNREEEFIDKISIANKTIDSLSAMLDKVKKTKKRNRS